MSISIAICTRNHSQSLGKVLRQLACLNLETKGVREILVVDNDSTDGTAEVAQLAGPALPVRWVSESRRGVAYARNRALSEAAGELLVFLDDDVFVAEGWLEELTRPVVHEGYDAALGYISLPDYALQSRLPPELHHYFACVDDAVFDEGGPKWIVTANFCVRKSAIPSGLLFDVELGPGRSGFAEDLLFYLQLRANGRKVAAAPKAAAVHRFSPDRLSPASLCEMARRFGESIAYVDHHWHRRIVARRWWASVGAQWACWRAALAEAGLLRSNEPGAVSFRRWKALEHLAYTRWMWRHRAVPPNYRAPAVDKAGGVRCSASP